jgi:hypothetical protein
MFDQTRGAGATIRRMFDFVFAEFDFRYAVDE